MIHATTSGIAAGTTATIRVYVCRYRCCGESSNFDKAGQATRKAGLLTRSSRREQHAIRFIIQTEWNSPKKYLDAVQIASEVVC